MAQFSTYKNLELPTQPEHYNIQVFNKNNMVIDSELHKLDLKNQHQDESLATKEALNTETTRASAKENEITQALNNEISRAIEAETINSDNLANEINRAITSEENISNNLSILISDLTSRLNTLADSDDTTLDQLSEIVAYIKNNKNIIDGVTTSKVDKVSGKGLSTNDYTTAEKNKLNGIAAGAEVNVQPDWDSTDTTSDSYIKNKPTSMPASNTTSDYSATDTSPVNGIAVNKALQTLDVASKGGSGKYIQSISEKDGKISAVEATMPTIPPAVAVKGNS